MLHLLLLFLLLLLLLLLVYLRLEMFMLLLLLLQDGGPPPPSWRVFNAPIGSELAPSRGTAAAAATAFAIQDFAAPPVDAADSTRDIRRHLEGLSIDSVKSDTAFVRLADALGRGGGRLWCYSACACRCCCCCSHAFAAAAAAAAGRRILSVGVSAY